MKTKHTPAPWLRKKLDQNHSVIHGSNGLDIVPRMITEPGKQSEADAKLIEAAPELLEAALIVQAFLASPEAIRFMPDTNKRAELAGILGVPILKATE